MHPILFRIPIFHLGSHSAGGFEIYTYGVVISVAFLIALLLAMKRGKAAGMSSEMMSDFCVTLLFAGVVGSRLLFILEEWKDYEGHFWEIFNLRGGGLSISGGLILAFIAGLWFVKKHKLDFWRTGDVIAPSIALGMGIGRIGCVFNGCCVGVSSALPWALVFPANPRYAGPRHPTQIYEMILDLIIFAVLLKGFRRSKPGAAFLWCGILVSAARFLVEFLRADAIPAGPLSFVQWICLATIFFAGFFLLQLQNKSVSAAGVKEVRPTA